MVAQHQGLLSCRQVKESMSGSEDLFGVVVNDRKPVRVFQVNGMKGEALPEIKYGEIETPPLTEIGTFIQQLAGAGAPLFPDDDLENHLRGMAHLPERRESAKGDVAAAGKKSVPAAQMNEKQPPPQAKVVQAPKPDKE